MYTIGILTYRCNLRTLPYLTSISCCYKYSSPQQQVYTCTWRILAALKNALMCVGYCRLTNDIFSKDLTMCMYMYLDNVQCTGIYTCTCTLYMYSVNNYSIVLHMYMYVHVQVYMYKTCYILCTDASTDRNAHTCICISTLYIVHLHVHVHIHSLHVIWHVI